MPNYPITAESRGILKELNVDNGVLFVDAVNNRVGINDTTPSYALDVNGDINIQVGHQIVFPDSSTMNSAALIGSATTVSADDDVSITADANTDANGAILFKIGPDTFAKLLNSGIFQIINGTTGANANSPYLYFTGNYFDGADHTINAGIRLVSGAAPYLEVAVPDDGATPALTSVFKITDTEIYPTTTNTVDLGLTGTRFKSAYFSGTVTTVNATVTGLLTTAAFTTAFSAKAGDYVLTATDYMVTVDSSGGPVTITLPTAVGISGRHYVVKKISADANAVTLDGNGVETIDSQGSQVIVGQWVSIGVVSDGANWLII